MIVRTYGRRGRGLKRSYSDLHSESPSQESSENVYNFTFSSQDSAHCHWSDPYSFNSTQESTDLTILPSINADDFGDIDGGLWKRKKPEAIRNDLEPYGSSSSQEFKEFGVLEISEMAKKINCDPYDYNSSQELKEFGVLPKKTSKSVYDFSENGDIWNSKARHVDSDLYRISSSQEFHKLKISEPRKSKKCKKENGVLQKKKNKMKTKESKPGDLVLTTTATLMETQECGEMMEHVDEVNFALDGLKKEQQVKIRRASLLSLLSICGTAQQRRLLRVHGMAKTIIDAVYGLSLDDHPSNLAAAALVYLLASDGQEDRLLDSPNCICFLINLLKPLTSTGTKEKAATIGSKLLGMCRSAGLLHDSAKGPDSSSNMIMLKIQDILVNCKELKQRDVIDNPMEEPKLTPKWFSLRTMEKASLSTISIEDTSGIVRKTGDNFKEKLRDFGGLNAVFEVARTCHSTMEEWLEKSPDYALDKKDRLESLVLLLKCLKIMENMTFLSKDNQCHLLGMKGKFDGQRAPRSFAKLILSVIKILSGVSLLRNSLSSSRDDNMDFTDSQCSLESTQRCADPLLLKMRVESSMAVSCSGTSGNLNSVIDISSNDSELDVGFGMEQRARGKDSQDPFAFDENECEPSKWDFLSTTTGKFLDKINSEITNANKDVDQSVLLFSQQESTKTEIHYIQDGSCSSAGNDEKSNLLDECLLAAVKVLMNLANDNPEGCRQIATCGGLEILSSLIAGHFPSFSSSPAPLVDARDSSSRIDTHSSVHLTDQELDFLVAILGLLVNLVEKDGRNRSRLAAATISLPSINGFDPKNQRGVVSLLCSIFLTNHGAGEAAGEDKVFSLEDEECMLQGAKEAEKMIVEAYSALLLAFLSMESKTTRKAIAEHLPERKLAIVVPVLERFVEFHLTLNMISPETHSAVLEVIESCKRQ